MMNHAQKLRSGSFVCRHAILCIVALSYGFAAPITMQTIASVGPNNLLSPSWAQYASNALESLMHHPGTTGDPTLDPTAYAVAMALGPGDIILSSFESWEGDANPKGPFIYEYGNQLLFGLVLLGNGSYFRLSNLYNTMSSMDTGDAMGANSGGFGAYGPDLVGVDCGPDGVCGTADDMIYNSGQDASLPVNALYYVGVGAGFDASNEAGATNQEKLDSVKAYISANAPFTVSNTYTLYDDTGTNILANTTLTLALPETPTGRTSALFLCVLFGGLVRKIGQR